MVTLLLLLLLVVIAYGLTYVYRRPARALLAGLPTYSQLPFIGNMHWFMGGGRLLYERFSEISEVIEKTKLPFVIWIGPYPVLVISDPEDVIIVTNSFVEKPYFYNFAQNWVGNGLITAPVKVWKQNIKILGSTFNTSVVGSYQNIFNVQARRCVEKLKKEVGGEPFDVLNKYLTLFTLETICQTALGVLDISESIVTNEYCDAFNRIVELLNGRGFNIFKHPTFLYQLTTDYRELQKCIAVVHNVSELVITKRMREREMEKENAKNETSDGRPIKSFLDILLDHNEANLSFTEKEIKFEVNTIIVGGQEAVSITLFYILLMIGYKPHIQKKLYDEMQEIFGGTKRSVTKGDLSQMKYCEAVILETLRMYPPVPVSFRYADKAIQLKSCRVPEGASFGINALGAGRSRRIWGPDALEYRPERWLGAERPGHPAAFLAFNYGRRACIGKKYAMALMKTFLAHCVLELEVHSRADQLRLKMDLGLKAASGHLIQVGLRT
ncbi:cytochrome P450 4c21-like isoform X1 [Galleria mellonella]|uniref:Cytochrome P450 4c21-like isoform X1 n=1 Tax=Galleria mellonella TaxID=7137 RepID=A0ABM3MIK2_GALME|nr:cytochrome P450 4c21-like isoform X1 [Galleria mellonella]XP_052751222.1 cytochrome P450 4c21-like isoform X1 [Galleria mellonella]